MAVKQDFTSSLQVERSGNSLAIRGIAEREPEGAKDGGPVGSPIRAASLADVLEGHRLGRRTAKQLGTKVGDVARGRGVSIRNRVCADEVGLDGGGNNGGEIVDMYP
jgi:hypothetical protein